MVAYQVQMPPEAFGYHFGVAVSPDGSKVYVTNRAGVNENNNNVSVIDTTTNTVVGGLIPVGSGPNGAAITPDGSKVYIPNLLDNTVSVIDTAANSVIATIPVGNAPAALGIPIPVPKAAPTTAARCNGIYNGTFNGNVTVSAGQDCIFLGGRISGSVTVIGGNFALNRGAVDGNLKIAGGNVLARSAGDDRRQPADGQYLLWKRQRLGVRSNGPRQHAGLQ
jgi:YVTN family beta-propeller protein